MKDKWTFKLTDLAKEFNDESIIESLLIDLKGDVMYFPKLINLVEDRFKNSPKIMGYYKRNY